MRNDSADLRFAASLVGRPAHEVLSCNVPPDAIGDAKAAALYGAVVAVAGRVAEPTADDVIAELEERGRLATLGSAEEVHVLAALYALEAPESLRTAVLRGACLRVAAEAGARLLASANTGRVEEATAGLAVALQDVQRFQGSQRAEPMLHVNEHLEQLVELLAEYASGKRDVPNLADLGPLSVALGNPQPGSLVVIGGFSHAGKSFLMQHLEARYHERGIATLRLSLEDPDSVNRPRLASEMAGVSFSLANPTKRDAIEMLQHLGAHLNAANRRVARVVHTPESRDIYALLRDMRRGVRVVFVDYAQIVSVPNAYDSRAAVAATVGMLKAEAIRLGVTLVLGSQLRKPGNVGANHEPTPHDLKDASELHHASEVLVLCWREGHEINGTYRKFRLARIAKDKLTGSDGFAWMVDGPGGVVTRVVPVTRDEEGRIVEVEQEQSRPATAHEIYGNHSRSDFDG
jgi:replicative DNA helicase